MNELIRKQDAINAIKMDTGIIPFASAREYTKIALDTAHDRILGLPSAQQWILCEERMPEERGFYLVSGNGKVWICEMIIIMGTKGWSNNIANPIVSAWMPLPEPWKESEE